MNTQKDIKGVTRYTFTNNHTGEVVAGVFMFEDEDGTFIRTDNCPDDVKGADFGIHPFGFIDGMWSYARS